MKTTKENKISITIVANGYMVEVPSPGVVEKLTGQFSELIKHLSNNSTIEEEIEILVNPEPEANPIGEIADNLIKDSKSIVDESIYFFTTWEDTMKFVDVTRKKYLAD